MKQLYLALGLILSLSLTTLQAQTNPVVTNPLAEDILRGNFDPADYLPANPIVDPQLIAGGINSSVDTDSLKAYLEAMSTFRTRHTGSDTTSTTEGMGAARRWALGKFQSLSDRLIVSFFQFDASVCGMNQHRNIFAVLPGTGEHAEEFVLIQAHFDSRCNDNCDVECDAEGMEDNGSGSALVLELARVMTQYTFDRTLVFMLTTGEEQGLFGAEAFADFCRDNDLPLRAVYNNDTVGGIICGATSSVPSCPGLNVIDSTNVRIFSAGNLNSRHKMLARYVKLEYDEMIAPVADQVNEINIMLTEDREGRGGDHIPFRRKGYPAIRFTTASEHGNADTSNPDYNDRQHTSDDILGVDTNGDGIIDSFFVDFRYLARNTVINGNAAAMTALGPEDAVDFELNPVDNGFEVVIDDPNEYGTYRIGLRGFTELDFDTIFTIQAVDTLRGLNPMQTYVASVATVDENGIESLFIGEEFADFESNLDEITRAQRNIRLLQNRPNPFDEATYFGIYVEEVPSYRSASIAVRDLQGRTLAELPIELRPGLNEVLYDFRHQAYQPGVYSYTLIVDGYPLYTKRMIYAY
ncbi:MAG: M28 family peptidase [Bacteroidota bacterium]